MSTWSASTLLLKRSRMMPRVSVVSRCSSAGARRTKVFFRLIFFHSASSDSISRRKCSSVTPSATVRTITPPASLGRSLLTISRSLARCSALALSAHADLRGVRHVHQEAARQRDLGGDPAALGPDRLLGNLNGKALPLLEDVLDVGEGPAGRDLALTPFAGLGALRLRAVVAPPAPVATAPGALRFGGRMFYDCTLDHRFGSGRVGDRNGLLRRLFLWFFVFVRLEEIGRVEECALFLTDVDERRLNAREHRLDPAQVDITHCTAV